MGTKLRRLAHNGSIREIEKEEARPIRYRTIKRNDVSEIQGVARRAWTHTYGKTVPLAIINRFLSERYSDRRFERRIFPAIERGDSQFYLAIDDGRIIGYSNVRKYRGTWKLERIYLLPEYIGKGVGKKLLLLGERFFRRKRAKKFHAYVYVKNKRALEFYLRNGFVIMRHKYGNRAEFYLEKNLRHVDQNARLSVAHLPQISGLPGKSVVSP